jgi:hypothetical protein
MREELTEQGAWVGQVIRDFIDSPENTFKIP